MSVPKKQATSIDAHVGSQIRNRRNTLGMSQDKLGQLLGLTFQQVQKYERGINRIGAGRLFETARVLGVSILYFYEGVVDELSGRPLGFAEDAAPSPAPPKADGVELLAAFSRIRDEKVRKRVLELVKSLSLDPPPKAKRKRN
ncbi:MAG: helix-turn-helix transcriptional regulator [Alphaproteobacteria bacterium]|jgi:transcriptional regulator with XRE-family HTH domain|nr:helix-turn-helix transcriptional regulator [Alphaproteobacteria bacterium]